MNTLWIKGLTPKETEDRKRYVTANCEAYHLLKKVLEDHLEEPTPDYTNPSWAYEQAHVNGANAMLKKIIKMLDVEES